MNHGHVTPNPDGSKARCGGPGICNECSREYAEKHEHRFGENPDISKEKSALLKIRQLSFPGQTHDVAEIFRLANEALGNVDADGRPKATPL
jgi:hypothetical protein